MRRVLLACVLLAACTRAGSESPPNEVPVATAEAVKRVDSIPAVSPTPPPAPAPAPAPPPKKPVASARVELTAVTLADDCGGAPPWSSPKATLRTQTEMADEPQTRAKGVGSSGARARRRCEQTSMQLAITATDAMSVKVKSVKLYDESGKYIATLTATKPTKWSTTSSVYEGWNEAAPANTTINVSYVLSQPGWGSVTDRWNKTFTLKAVVTIGGVDKTTEKDVTLQAATTLPPNVRT